MKKYNIAIIEDDEWFSESIKYYLELNEENQVVLYKSGPEFFKKAPKPDIVCVDYNLPELNGDEIVKKLKKENPKLPIIVVSGQEDMQVALDLIKLGAKDYIIKTEHAKDLIWKAIEEVKENLNLKDQIVELEHKLAQHSQPKFVDLLGEDDSIKRVRKLILKASETNITVSITGETGTGKEVVAKSIHSHTFTKKEPFVAVNMGAIPSELIESELFGYEKGAFSGAIKKTKGKFELAHGGTIFLDEIAELDLSLQSKILRVLQEQEITPLGSESTQKISVRVIVATHKNLLEEVQKGTFREDLYYRILGLPLNLPPLRERGNDILLLSNFFIKEFCKTNKIEELQLSKPSKEKLLKHTYPGNIRELKAVIDLACVMAEGTTILPEDIQINTLINTNYFSENLTLKEITDKIILQHLEHNDNNVIKTAKKLDIGKSTIYNLLKTQA